MSDIPKRRVADNMPNPTLMDIIELLHEMQNNQQGYISAFPLDDLGKPDYTGHRKKHIADAANEKALEGYKTGLTKSILEWVVKGVLALTGIALFNLIATKIAERMN
jgi:hypothetical protein